MHQAANENAVEAPSSDEAETGEERRRQPRYAISLAITFEGLNNFYAGLSENMSQAGVFVATAHRLPIGTEVVMTFTLPGEAAPIRVAGTVQWARTPEAMATPFDIFARDEAMRSVQPGVGIRFTEMNDDAARAIVAFMAKRDPEFYA